MGNDVRVGRRFGPRGDGMIFGTDAAAVVVVVVVDLRVRGSEAASVVDDDDDDDFDDDHTMGASRSSRSSDSMSYHFVQ